jgi:hypothetical protein
MTSISERKRLAAIQNAKKATAAVLARVALKPKWHCATCNAEAPATVHQLRKTYCSKACMAEGYRKRMAGAANPNYRGGGAKQCEFCGGVYHRYNKDARFCSWECRDRWERPMRTAPRKDANHVPIVEALRKMGAVVLDLSRQAHGCPDLLVGRNGAWNLVEIKNPKTYYGKAGLSKSQKRWADEWKPCPYYVFYSVDDAVAFMNGSLPTIWGDKPELANTDKHAGALVVVASVGEALDVMEAA